MSKEFIGKKNKVSFRECKTYNIFNKRKIVKSLLDINNNNKMINIKSIFKFNYIDEAIFKQGFNDNYLID